MPNPQPITTDYFQIGDLFEISVDPSFEISTQIVDILEDGVVIELDDYAIHYLMQEGFDYIDGELAEEVSGPKKCWKGFKKVGTKPGTGENAGKQVNDCEKISEAEYQGRKVQLNKKMSNTDGKSKSKVYVRDPKTGNVKKVTFGDKNMRIKKNNPARRKSFRARHRCDTANDKTTARYWSCRSW